MNSVDDDFAIALQLQQELIESENDQSAQIIPTQNPEKPMSLVDPYWEVTDPIPDVRALFLTFNDEYFWGRLAGIEVRWSPRMTVCAGLCCYEGRGGLCSVRLSVPLLKLRPRKDLVETLLHEMIHAYLFVTDNNKDHDGHGPEFHKHMYRINAATGTSISVYHNFHDEVAVYKQHWWRCDGPCRSRKPYFGFVKRSMNRAPSKNDMWWAEHERTCGGSYTKVKEPEDYGKKKGKKKSENGSDSKKEEKDKGGVKSMDIRVFAGKGKTLTGSSKTSSTISQPGPSSLPTEKGPSPSVPVVDSVKRPSSSSVRDRSGSGIGTVSKTSSVKKGTPKLPPSQNPKGLDSDWKFKEGSQKSEKAKFLSTNFSDSDDDDDLLLTCDSKTGTFDDEDDDLLFNCDGDSESTANSGTANEENGCETELKENFLPNSEPSKTETSSSSSSTSVNNSDVQAMLRKVWGERKFTGSKLSPLETKPFSGDTTETLKSGGVLSSTGRKRHLSGSSSDRSPQKIRRDSTSSINKHSKQNGANQTFSPKKGKRNSSFVIYDKKATTDAPSTSSTAQKKSPIKDLFKKMKDKKGGGDSLTKGDNSRTPPDSESSATSECPVCCKHVPVSIINQHLDECLSVSYLSGK